MRRQYEYEVDTLALGRQVAPDVLNGTQRGVMSWGHDAASSGTVGGYVTDVKIRPGLKLAI